MKEQIVHSLGNLSKCNFRPVSFMLVAFFCLSLLTVLSLQPSTQMQGFMTEAKGKPSPSPTPSDQTTSTIFDKTVDDSQFVDLRSDDLNPDLTPTGGTFGIYGTSSITNVQDRFEGAVYSDWSLHTENSTSRWISLTLNRLTGSGPAGVYNLHGRVISRCFDPTGATTNTGSFPAIITSDPNCSMHVNFTLTGNDYGLIMSPYYANTGRAEVSCTATSGGQCVAWDIVPNLVQDSVVNPNPLVAILLLNGKGGKQTLIGTYSLTYRIHLTRP